ncbi:M23 family metallopeptidase [Moraxella nasovis]|uniref:M23 family metallopeptidase n=1 Tax=Moraxella nasovis TaxID=2904121 RepID=UPI001F5FF973|nr:M23 family metallopeptidase [Moraxella nasovis]UNU73069.1 M23 family metallopeptidase [Moraxella nasovis]
MNVLKQKAFNRVMIVSSVAAIVALTGCASKPTYHPNSKSTKNYSGPNRYLVRQGDTVSKIAERYGVEWRQIARLNNLDSDYTIYVGQWLTLWEKAELAPTKRTPPPVQSQVKAIPQQPIYTPRPNQVAPIVVNTPKPQISQNKPKPVIVNTPVSSTGVAPIVGSAGLMQFTYPVSKNNPVVRRFGTNTIGNKSVTSDGMWFAGNGGDLVFASRSGVVTHVDGNGVAGAMVMIRHDDGFTSSYIHIKDAGVRVGQSVIAGQQIAKMREQGSAALLEFRVAKNGVYVDPLMVLK